MAKPPNYDSDNNVAIEIPNSLKLNVLLQANTFEFLTYEYARDSSSVVTVRIAFHMLNICIKENNLITDNLLKLGDRFMSTHLYGFSPVWMREWFFK